MREYKSTKVVQSVHDITLSKDDSTMYLVANTVEGSPYPFSYASFRCPCPGKHFVTIPVSPDGPQAPWSLSLDPNGKPTIMPSIQMGAPGQLAPPDFGPECHFFVTEGRGRPC